MATYLPTKNVTPVYTFVQKTSTSAALQTALLAAFPGMDIQCFDDAAHAGNTLVVASGEKAFTVAANQYVGYNLGQWEVQAASKMAGGVNSVYTAYTP